MKKLLSMLFVLPLLIAGCSCSEGSNSGSGGSGDSSCTESC